MPIRNHDPMPNRRTTSTESYLSTENRAFKPSHVLIRVADTAAEVQESMGWNPPMEFPDEDEIRENSIGGKNVSWSGAAVAAWGIPHPYPKGWMEALRSKDEKFFAHRGIHVRRRCRCKPIPWEEDGLFVWS